MYVMYRRYICSWSTCKKPSNGLQLLEYLPDIYKAKFPFEAKGTPRSRLVHRQLLHLVLFDALTGKTFSEIGETIANYRSDEYLRRRCLFVLKYDSMFKNKNGIIGDQSVSENANICFSQFDDPNGYNELLQPTDKVIIEMSIHFVCSQIRERNERYSG